MRDSTGHAGVVVALTVVMASTHAVRLRSGTSMMTSKKLTISAPSNTPPPKPMYPLASSSVRNAPYSEMTTVPSSKKAEK